MLHPADVSVLWSFSHEGAAAGKYGAELAAATTAAAAAEEARLTALKEAEERDLKVSPKDWMSYKIHGGSGKFTIGQVYTICKRFKGWYNVTFYAKGQAPKVLQVQMTPKTFHRGMWKFDKPPSASEMTALSADGKTSVGGGSDAKEEVVAGGHQQVSKKRKREHEAPRKKAKEQDAPSKKEGRNKSQYKHRAVKEEKKPVEEIEIEQEPDFSKMTGRQAIAYLAMQAEKDAAKGASEKVVDDHVPSPQVWLDDKGSKARTTVPIQQTHAPKAVKKVTPKPIVPHVQCARDLTCTRQNKHCGICKRPKDLANSDSPVGGKKKKKKRKTSKEARIAVVVESPIQMPGGAADRQVVQGDWVAYKLQEGAKKLTIGQVHTAVKRYSGWHNIMFYTKGKPSQKLQVQLISDTYERGMWTFAKAPSAAEMKALGSPEKKRKREPEKKIPSKKARETPNKKAKEEKDVPIKKESKSKEAKSKIETKPKVEAKTKTEAKSVTQATIKTEELKTKAAETTLEEEAEPDLSKMTGRQAMAYFAQQAAKSMEQSTEQSMESMEHERAPSPE
jgi:hypothetical protein